MTYNKKLNASSTRLGDRFIHSSNLDKYHATSVGEGPDLMDEVRNRRKVNNHGLNDRTFTDP